MNKTIKYLFLALLLSIFFSCASNDKEQIIVFHAGSLAVPFKQMKDVYEKQHPEVEILLEAAGSVDCARKITDLKKDCDIMASADYTIIDEFLIPNNARWNILFAGNEMCIVYTDKSAYADKINSENWTDILLREDVRYARSNPDADPCGYRTVLVSKLAEDYYQKFDFSNKLMEKDKEYIRPKEVDLIALLETRTVDYIFLYRSVAEQHKLNYLLLPDTINLKKPSLNEHYAKAEVKILGEKPREYLTKKGQSMTYGICLLDKAPNKTAAENFLAFILSEEGRKIMEDNGQSSLIPAPTSTFKAIPEKFKAFAKEK
jgi:molybdate/tungstate transport system substrate-binding protein